MRIVVDTNIIFSAILNTNSLFARIILQPTKVLSEAENLLSDIDIDDTEFVALTTHIRGKLWSGDKKLQTGLIKKGWNKFVSTDELYKTINLRK